ncbi:MAG: rRNA maturation RNase YbeY [Chlamydiales bacterium]|nr:rRNA maturation RNase YbeY [Chlamydiia bacterium]MCP5504712.1 rRNA maturation RNase YbeY [Chlamydiales bacterium]
MNVHTTNNQSALSINHEDVERLVKSFLKWKKVACDEVIIHFVKKDEICHLHKEHFQDPTPTDCISFPIDSPDEATSGYSILGEVFVCPEVAIEYVNENGGNPYLETSLYIIHGLLHLLGYDDQDDESRAIMRAQEKSAMLYLERNKEILDAV